MLSSVLCCVLPFRFLDIWTPVTHTFLGCTAYLQSLFAPQFDLISKCFCLNQFQPWLAIENLNLCLGENRLTRRIPSELGRLQTHGLLDLYTNNFTGPLSPGIGNNTSLELLDVPINHLTGRISIDLGSLIDKEQLDLSENYLNFRLYPFWENWKTSIRWFFAIIF